MVTHWTQSASGKGCRAVGSRDVQTQMLLEVGPNVYQQILILSLDLLRPLLDNAGVRWWVWAPGCRLRNVDAQGSVFAYPPELDIPQCDYSPVSGPKPQHNPIQGICTGTALLVQHS